MIDLTHTPEQLSAAIDAVVTRFAAMVRSVGARHGLSDAELDEVMQDVRIRLWRADPRGERIGQLSTSYVYRTAVSAALDLLRKLRTRVTDSTDSLEVLEDRAGAVPATVRGPEEVVAGEELERRILAVVEALQPARRAAVRLYLSGYECAEIARLMGWTDGKTRNLLSRGLANVREQLRREGITGQGEIGNP